MGQFVDILIGQLLTIHLFNALRKQLAVQTDKTGFRQLADKGGDVLMLHIGIGIKLRTCGSIRSL